MAFRAAMHQMGGALLEKLLNTGGGGYQGAHLDCSQGHPAEFVGYRGKQILTVLSSVEVQRAYYHCAPARVPPLGSCGSPYPRTCAGAPPSGEEPGVSGYSGNLKDSGVVCTEQHSLSMHPCPGFAGPLRSSLPVTMWR
jgi:hypothetical protein